jgi:hypothetical protein
VRDDLVAKVADVAPERHVGTMTMTTSDRRRGHACEPRVIGFPFALNRMVCAVPAFPATLTPLIAARAAVPPSKRRPSSPF